MYQLNIPLTFDTSITSILDMTSKIISDKSTCCITKLQYGDLECKYSNTFINYCECIQVNNLLQSANKLLKIDKNIIQHRHYVVDTTFPLYHNFFCYRESYIGSQARTRSAKSLEVNLYYCIPKLIYIMTGNASKYNDVEFFSRYSEKETLQLCDSMASITLGYNNLNDFKTLERLFERDEVLSKELSKIKALADSDYQTICLSSYIKSEPLSKVEGDVTALSILQTYISVLLAPLLAKILQTVKRLQNGLHIRSLSDFRILFEVEQSKELTITFSLTHEQYGDAELKPRIFTNKERIEILKQTANTYL